MNPTKRPSKYLPLSLFALLAGGCVDAELMVPLSLEVDEPIPVVTELEPEEPGDPAPDAPDDGGCGDLVATHPDAVVFDDVRVTGLADVELLGEVVAITGNFDVAVDEVVDFSALSSLRCIGGDVRVRAGSDFSIDDLPALQMIGGAFVADLDGR